MAARRHPHVPRREREQRRHFERPRDRVAGPAGASGEELLRSSRANAVSGSRPKPARGVERERDNAHAREWRIRDWAQVVTVRGRVVQRFLGSHPQAAVRCGRERRRRGQPRPAGRRGARAVQCIQAFAGRHHELVARRVAPDRFDTEDSRRSGMPAASVVRQAAEAAPRDRKSTRLNSSHLGISYAVFCLKKKKKKKKKKTNNKDRIKNTNR